MANEKIEQLYNLEAAQEKTDRIKSCLQKMIDVKNELAEFGISVNENLTTDKDKWAAYWGL